MVTSGQAGWALLFLLAVCLMVIGFQGNLGCLVGVLFCPAYVETQE